MVNVPKKVSERLIKQIGIFQKVLREAKDRDINESDTVTIVTDMLGSVFGFDKYSEITSEQAIRGTYCDLAVKTDGTIKYLIEVKAIGLTLKENHLKQAIDYGANQGITWVVLTNGTCWEAYRIIFHKPIESELVFRLDFLDLSPRKRAEHDLLFLLCREGLSKEAIKEYHERAQSVNRFVVAAIIQSEPLLRAIRRELKRIAPKAKVDTDEIEGLLPDILKRDVIEGEAAKRARHLVKKGAHKPLRKVRSESSNEQKGHLNEDEVT